MQGTSTSSWWTSCSCALHWLERWHSRLQLRKRSMYAFSQVAVRCAEQVHALLLPNSTLSHWINSSRVASKGRGMAHSISSTNAHGGSCGCQWLETPSFWCAPCQASPSSQSGTPSNSGCQSCCRCLSWVLWWKKTLLRWVWRSSVFDYSVCARLVEMGVARSSWCMRLQPTCSYCSRQQRWCGASWSTSSLAIVQTRLVIEHMQPSLRLPERNQLLDIWLQGVYRIPRVASHWCWSWSELRESPISSLNSRT